MVEGVEVHVFPCPCRRVNDFGGKSVDAIVAVVIFRLLQKGGDDGQRERIFLKGGASRIEDGCCVGIVTGGSISIEPAGTKGFNEIRVQEGVVEKKREWG